MNILGIIPARSGSKGVPKKNIRLLSGYPLIAYSIVAAKLSKQIDRIIVSTDSEEIAKISRFYGADVPFLRPPEYAQDNSPDKDLVIHAINWFEINERKIPQFIVHLRPTTPLRNPAIINKAIKEIIGRPDASCLRSAHISPESPFKWFLIKENGYFTGLQTDDMDALNQPRQMFPTVYVPNGYIDVLRTDFIKQSNNIHGNRMLGFVSPFCHEIDTVEDLKMIEYQLKTEGSPVLNYLRQNFNMEG